MKKELPDVVDPRAIENDYTEIVPFAVFYKTVILSRLSKIRRQNEIQLIFSGITSNIFDELASKEGALFAKALSAEISKDAAAGKLYVSLPKKSDESHILRLISDE